MKIHEFVPGHSDRDIITCNYQKDGNGGYRLP